MLENIDLDHYCMRVAVAAAVRNRSFPLGEGRLKTACVGCIIRRERSHDQPRQIIAIGWNDGLFDHECVGDGSRVDLAYSTRTCAERNAVHHTFEGVRGATVYTTHMPCTDCAALLCKMGVKRVIYLFWRHEAREYKADQGKSKNENNTLAAVQCFQTHDITCAPLRHRRAFLCDDMTPKAFDLLNSGRVCMLVPTQKKNGVALHRDCKRCDSDATVRASAYIANVDDSANEFDLYSRLVDIENDFACGDPDIGLDIVRCSDPES